MGGGGAHSTCPPGKSAIASRVCSWGFLAARINPIHSRGEPPDSSTSSPLTMRTCNTSSGRSPPRHDQAHNREGKRSFHPTRLTKMVVFALARSLWAAGGGGVSPYDPCLGEGGRGEAGTYNSPPVLSNCDKKGSESILPSASAQLVPRRSLPPTSAFPLGTLKAAPIPGQRHYEVSPRTQGVPHPLFPTHSCDTKTMCGGAREPRGESV